MIKLTLVELEPFSLCNRRCDWCPNSFIDRYSFYVRMPWDLITKIGTELGEMKYYGRIALGRYNEPLADDIIYDVVETLHEMVPEALIQFNTNGDYLTPERKKRLVECGLGKMRIQLYPPHTKESIKKALGGAPYGMAMQIYKKTRMGNRGGLLPHLDGAEREEKCKMPFHGAFIDFNGSVMPCCSLRSDVEAHREYIIGDIATHTLREILEGEKAERFRDTKLPDVCKKCWT